MANNYSKLTDKVNGRKIQVDSAVRDGLGNKIDTNYILSDGYYPQLGAGFADLADNLTPYGDNSGAESTTAFTFQTSGGNSDVGSTSQLRQLRGNTIIWNQLVRYNNRTVADVEGTFADGIYTLNGTSTAEQAHTYFSYSEKRIADHKYLWVVKKVGGSIDISNKTTNNQNGYFITANLPTLDPNKISLFDNETYYQIVEGSSDSNDAQYFRLAFDENVVFDNAQFICMCFDLTNIFGAGNEPTDIVEFNRLFPKTYYDYNSGTLMSCNSSSYKIVGYNAFDVSSTTKPSINTKTCEISTFIRAIAGQKYTIEFDSSFPIAQAIYLNEYDINQNAIILGSPTNDNYVYDSRSLTKTLTNETQYIRVILYYSVEKTPQEWSDLLDALCIHLTWDNSKTGFEEYYTETYNMPAVELRKVGDIYDSVLPNGTLTRKIGVVDLGDLITTQTSNSNGALQIDASSLGIKANNDFSVVCNLLCAKYKTDNYSNVYSATTKNSIAFANNALCIQDDSFINQTANQIKTLLTGAYLYYELNTPTTSNVSSYIENQKIDDFGTQEFISEQAIQVPQGNYFFYPVNYKAFMDSLGGREDIEYDASQLVSQTELQTALSNIPSGGGDDKLDTSFTGVSEYNSDTTYTAGNKCWHNGKMYVANDTTTGDFDSTKWIEVTLNDYVDLDSDQIFNVINASDIVNNTLTQAQYDLITNGKPTLINGTILSYYDLFIMPLLISSKNFDVVCFSRGRMLSFSCNNTTKIISINPNTAAKNQLQSIGEINGKAIPAYPSNTGTFVLKCVNGTLTWVEEWYGTQAQYDALGTYDSNIIYNILES